MNSSQAAHLRLLGFIEMKHSRQSEFALMCPLTHATRCVRVSTTTNEVWTVYPEDDESFVEVFLISDALNAMADIPDE